MVCHSFEGVDWNVHVDVRVRTEISTSGGLWVPFVVANADLVGQLKNLESMEGMVTYFEIARVTLGPLDCD